MELWAGSRHRSWASDTAIFGVVFVVVLAITALTDYLNGPADPPAYLIATLAAASTALFGAASSDKGKRDREVSATATRAESKADDALGRADASADATQLRVLGVQEREFAANRAALQLMRDAVEVKESAGIPVLPATIESIRLLERQTDLLAADIRERREQISAAALAARGTAAEVGETAKRAEAKADDALDRSDAALQRETEWSQHRDHAHPTDSPNRPRAEGEQ
jgi:hypothetical protein